MPTFKNLDSLYNHLEKQIQSSLLDEVAEGVRDVMQVEIQDAVYSTYSPKKYERRYDKGGLLDKQNMEAFLDTKSNTLEVYNFTPFNNRYETNNTGYRLSELVEFGHNYNRLLYDYPSNGEYMKPRPFMKQTIDSIAKMKTHVGDLKNGLKNRHINVK